MNPLALKATICAIIALGASYWGYKLRDLSADSDISTLKKNASIEREKSALMLSQEVLKNDLLKNRLHSEAIENEKLVSAAHQRLVNVRRVFLPATLCADYGQAESPGGSAVSAPGTGVLPEQAEGQNRNPQLAMDELISGLKADSEVMDGVVENCRVVNGWVKGL